MKHGNLAKVDNSDTENVYYCVVVRMWRHEAMRNAIGLMHVSLYSIQCEHIFPWPLTKILPS